MTQRTSVVVCWGMEHYDDAWWRRMQPNQPYGCVLYSFLFGAVHAMQCNAMQACIHAYAIPCLPACVPARMCRLSCSHPSRRPTACTDRPVHTGSLACPASSDTIHPPFLSKVGVQCKSPCQSMHRSGAGPTLPSACACAVLATQRSRGRGGRPTQEAQLVAGSPS